MPYTKGNTKGYHIYIKLKNKPEVWKGSEHNKFKDFMGDLIGWNNNIWETKGKILLNYNSECEFQNELLYEDLFPLLLLKEKYKKEKKVKVDKKSQLDVNKEINNNFELNPENNNNNISDNMFNE